jgi:hypothetical protein
MYKLKTIKSSKIITLSRRDRRKRLSLKHGRARHDLPTRGPTTAAALAVAGLLAATIRFVGVTVAKNDLHARPTTQRVPKVHMVYPAVPVGVFLKKIK